MGRAGGGGKGGGEEKERRGRKGLTHNNTPSPARRGLSGLGEVAGEVKRASERRRIPPRGAPPLRGPGSWRRLRLLRCPAAAAAASLYTGPAPSPRAEPPGAEEEQAAEAAGAEAERRKF